MNENFLSDKILLKIVLVFEIAVTILIAIGVLPREYAFSITAAMLIYIAGASIIDSAMLAIISIPFYLALPVTASFDTMANWRIIILILFLKYALKKIPNIKYQIPPKESLCDSTGQAKIETLKSKNIRRFIFNKNARLEIWGLLFAIISFLSLIGASNISVGIKKILFLANIFLFFIIIKNIARDKEIFLKILKASILAGIFILVIGYAQLISILFFSLAAFWQFWAENAIAALYGANLSNLLSYSNTWFSYYSGDIPPTLRMFSIFPDSHSFALFNIILIPFILTLVRHYKNNIGFLIVSCPLLILILLAIIFSGSRGAWTGAVAPLGIIILLKIFNIRQKHSIANNNSDQIPNTKYQKYKLKTKKLIKDLLSKKLGIIASTILLFFLLFPVSSMILEQTQKAEWRRLNTQGDFASFAMYKRLRSIIDLDEISNKGRVEIWRDTLISIKKHPILGVGIGNFTTVIGKNISAAKKGASAHNLFLDIFAETGILGLAAFLAIFYEIAKTALSAFKNSTDELHKFFALSAGIYLFWILGYALFDVVLFNDKALMLFMIMIGLLYGINNINSKTEAQTIIRRPASSLANRGEPAGKRSNLKPEDLVLN